MARYLCWDNEDKYYHLCTSLEGTAGQVLWDADPQATTKSISRLLQTRLNYRPKDLKQSYVLYGVGLRSPSNISNKRFIAS